MSFLNINWRRKKDEDEEKRSFGFTRQKEKQPIKISSNNPNTTTSNVNFKTDPNQRDLKVRKIRIKPAPIDDYKRKSIVDRFAELLPDNIDSSKEGSREYGDYRTATDEKRQKIERRFDTPTIKSDEYRWWNPAHIVGTAQRATARTLANSIPTGLEFMLGNIHRGSRSIEAQRKYDIDNLRRTPQTQLTPQGTRFQNVKARESAQREREEAVAPHGAFYREQLKNQPKYIYNPLSGRHDTYQQENIRRQDEMGQSKQRAGWNTGLDIASFALDISDVGAPAKIGASLTAKAVIANAPMFLAGMKRAKPFVSKISHPFSPAKMIDAASMKSFNPFRSFPKILPDPPKPKDGLYPPNYKPQYDNFLENYDLTKPAYLREKDSRYGYKERPKTFDVMSGEAFLTKEQRQIGREESKLVAGAQQYPHHKAKPIGFIGDHGYAGAIYKPGIKHFYEPSTLSKGKKISPMYLGQQEHSEFDALRDWNNLLNNQADILSVNKSGELVEKSNTDKVDFQTLIENRREPGARDLSGNVIENPQLGQASEGKMLDEYGNVVDDSYLAVDKSKILDGFLPQEAPIKTSQLAKPELRLARKPNDIPTGYTYPMGRFDPASYYDATGNFVETPFKKIDDTSKKALDSVWEMHQRSLQNPPKEPLPLDIKNIKQDAKEIDKWLKNPEAILRAEIQKMKSKATWDNIPIDEDKMNVLQYILKSKEDGFDLKRTPTGEIIVKKSNNQNLQEGNIKIVPDNQPALFSQKPKEVPADPTKKLSPSSIDIDNDWLDKSSLNPKIKITLGDKAVTIPKRRVPETGEVSVIRDGKKYLIDSKTGEVLDVKQHLASKADPNTGNIKIVPENQSVKLSGKSPYLAKDQAKADKANKFIGFGAKGSSTDQYAKDFGKNANVAGKYSPSDKIFVSINGSRPGRLGYNWEYDAHLNDATNAGATIIIDDAANRARSYNVGERELESALTALGYVEEGNTGVFRESVLEEPIRKSYKQPSKGKEGYEVSTKGDSRFSAFNAKLRDGRTIEEAYQQAKGSGKGQPAKDKDFKYWDEYLGLWRQWADENPKAIAELKTKSTGKELTDMFASTDNNQARALETILREESAPKTARYLDDKLKSISKTSYNKPDELTYSTSPKQKTLNKMDEYDRRTGEKMYSLYDDSAKTGMDDETYRLLMAKSDAQLEDLKSGILYDEDQAGLTHLYNSGEEGAGYSDEALAQVAEIDEILQIKLNERLAKSKVPTDDEYYELAGYLHDIDLDIGYGGITDSLTKQRTAIVAKIDAWKRANKSSPKKGNIKIVDEKSAKKADEFELDLTGNAQESMGRRLSRPLITGSEEVSRQGEGGKVAATLMEEVRIGADTIHGKYDNMLKKGVLSKKLSLEEQAEAIDFLHFGKGQPTGKVKEAAETLKEIFVKVRKEAKEKDIKMGTIIDYFPIEWNMKYITGSKSHLSIQHLIKKGLAKNEEHATKLLEEYSETLKGRKSGHLEYKRGEKALSLPDEARIKNFDVVKKYLKEISLRFAEKENYGADDIKLKKLIQQMSDEGYDGERAYDIIKRYTGEEGSSGYGDVGRGVARAVNVPFLPFAGFQNLTQSVNIPAFGGLRNTGKMIGDFAKDPKGYLELNRKAHVYDPGYRFQQIGEFDPTKIESGISGLTMTLTEKILRGMAGGVGMRRGEEMAEYVGKNGFPTADTMKGRRALDKMEVIGLRPQDVVNGKLTDEAAIRVRNAFADKTQFVIDNLKVPNWMRNEKAVLSAQYLHFQYKQMRLMGTALKHAKNGNFVPIVTLLVGSPIAAYGTKKAYNFVTFKDKPVQEKPKDTMDYVDNTVESLSGALGAPAKLYSDARHMTDFVKDDRNTLGQKAIKLGAYPLGVAPQHVGELGVSLLESKRLKDKQKEEEIEEGDFGYKDPNLKLKRWGASNVPVAGKIANNTVLDYPDSPKEKLMKSEGYKEQGVPMADAMLPIPKLVANVGIGAANEILGSEKPSKVTRVVDGDTVILDNGQKLRIIGADTPERAISQGEQTKKRLANMLLDKEVEVKVQVDREDVYGRLLGDIYVDGKSVSKVLIDEGLARQTTYPANVKNVEELSQAQKEAEAKKTGFWGDPDLEIEREGDDYGKDPGFFKRLGKKKHGKNIADLEDHTISKFEGKTLEEARKVEIKGDYTDEDLLDIRATADGYAKYFMGAKYNPSSAFNTGDTLKDKLIQGYKNAEGSGVKSKLDDIYTASNYSEEEKNYLYDKMGFTEAEAERVTLYYVKDEGGMDQASPIIENYMREKGFTEETAKNLIEDGTLTKPQINSMYDQDLITDEEYDILQSLVKNKNSWSTSKSSSSHTKNSGTRTSKSKSSYSAKGKKLTPYKTQIPKPVDTDYFKDLMGGFDMGQAPKIKFTIPPSQSDIDSKFVVKDKKPAKIKVNFNTGLNK